MEEGSEEYGGYWGCFYNCVLTEMCNETCFTEDDANHSLLSPPIKCNCMRGILEPDVEYCDTRSDGQMSNKIWSRFLVQYSFATRNTCCSHFLVYKYTTIYPSNLFWQSYIIHFGCITLFLAFNCCHWLQDWQGYK